MASFSPTSVKSEPAGVLYSVHQSSVSLSSSEDRLPGHTDNITSSSSSPIDTAASGSSAYNTSADALQGYSAAPTVPVYINLGLSEHTDELGRVGPTTTSNQPLSPPSMLIDVDHPLPPTTIQRYSQHHHHHFPHHQQNRNRYPYLQRPVIARGAHRTQTPTTTADNSSYYEQRPAFRRAYFALRRQRIPKGTEENL